MVYCCIPKCNSSSGKGKRISNGKTISFHEIPSNAELRKRWLYNIHRKDWIPTDTSVVCSKHFLEDDFRPNLKVAVLKEHVVPSVFDHYPKYLQVAAQKNQMRKKPLIRLPPANSAINVNKVEQLSQQQIDDYKLMVEKIVRGEDIQSHLYKNGMQVEDCDENGEENPSLPAQAKNTPLNGLPFRPSLNKTVGRPLQQRQKVSYRKLQMRNSSMKGRLKKLRTAYKDLQRDYNELQNKDADFNLDKIQESANVGKIEAIFLLDLLRTFDCKAPRWSEPVIRHCLNWRAKGPSNYDYCRKTFISLPSKSTLQRASSGKLKMTLPETNTDTNAETNVDSNS